ncbi:sulfurtransferase [Bacillus timonensis]|nr:sulfurtransferase [Bacillus timonensis]
MYKNIVSIDWLWQNINNDDLRIIDCRFDLKEPDKGYKEYISDHIPGSVYFHLDHDLSSSVQLHGGRHPLPTLDLFVKKVSKSGIGNKTKVIIYDDQDGAFASRCWWLFKYIGHIDVFVLEENFTQWKNRGLPVSKEISNYKEKVYIPSLQSNMLASMKDIKDTLNTETVQLIDSRESMRYTGEMEPIDKKSGRIPGAQHYFWKNVIDNSGKWKDISELISNFKTLDKNKQIIVYCGSGVTACPNVLALNEAGYDQVQLYAGSWSDWISYDENPIEYGK